MSRRSPRWVVLLLLVLGVPFVIYQVLARVSEVGSPLEVKLLPSLSLALVVLTLGLAGVLIRNLVKLILESKRGIFGSQLRIKLVFFVLALVLLPAIVLFSGSVQVIKQTVEAILREPRERLTGGGREIVDEWREHFKAQSMNRAMSLAEEIRAGGYLEPVRRAELASLLEHRRTMEGLEVLVVVAADETIARAEDVLEPELRPQYLERLEELIQLSRRGGGIVGRIERLGTGLVAQAAAPVPGSPPAGFVGVASAVPQRIAVQLTNIDAEVQTYDRFRAHRRELIRLYVVLIGLIFVATIFVATWVGFYVSRRITEPIQNVAAATREIAAGNLAVRVRTQVGNEMGALVDAFNEMAAELQENREIITRSTADLRRSNQALDERRRYIETLVASLSTAVVSLEPSGRVITSNPAVEKILGFRFSRGEDARTALSGHGLTELADLVGQSLKSGTEGGRRDLELPESAPALHVSVQVSPLKGRDGEDLGALMMVEDLTDLLRAQKAAAWQEVARRMAHEIKNPLTPIQLSAQRLRKKFLAGANDLEQVILEATDSIEREVAGLKKLVDEFSRFARLPEVQLRQVELDAIVESVLALYRGAPGIHWTVELDPRVGRVEMDPQQMRRVLINLIDNALAAMNGEGAVRLTTRVLGPDGAVRIEVADSGPGIAQTDRDRMFLPYFSTKKKGSGLGLAIVHKVVTDHQGTIRVENNAPHGARFVIEIPARRAVS